MTARAERIRTPDQRLRIFVSSTLQELAPERKAARAAIERLHLAPVMFELGSRPHPPRELYRAYLAQSDVFVGLYWDRYGWVAPGEQVSGLEDEYQLAPADMPKLIYLKESGGEREPRLVELIDRIRQDDTASYSTFATPEQLAEAITGDLATLLAERFDLSRVPDAAALPPVVAPDTVTPLQPLPVSLTRFIDRQDELARIAGLLAGGVRLITVLGPGGIGKSRIAIEAARQAAPTLPGGVAFVDLAPVRSVEAAVGVIALAVGIRNTGDAPVADKLVTALRTAPPLLLLDNAEQLADNAAELGRLLANAPEVRAIVTSRARLRVSGEQVVPIGPLRLPAADEPLARIAEAPAVALFVERCRAVRPDFELTDENRGAITSICAMLDGVPLAIELAAARIRVLPPEAMLERLDRQLSLLSGGSRDLPERQRALRSTIEWSTDLLAPAERRLLEVLGVFAGRFSFEAAEAVAEAVDGTEDALTLLDALIDSSLVREHDHEGRPYFSLLATVREFAWESLDARGAQRAARDAHARHYRAVAAAAARHLQGPQQPDWLGRLLQERTELRQVMRYLLSTEPAAAAEYAWDLYVYWWIVGNLGQVRDWMSSLLDLPRPLPEHARAVALYFAWAISFWQDRLPQLVPGLEECVDLFRGTGDRTGTAMAMVSLAMARITVPGGGDAPGAPTGFAPGSPAGVAAASAAGSAGASLAPGADPVPGADPAPGAVGAVPAEAGPQEVHAPAAVLTDTLESSLGLFRQAGDRWGEAMALVVLGRVFFATGQTDAAAARFGDSVDLARTVGDSLGRAIALHHRGWTDLIRGDAVTAAAAFCEALGLSVGLSHQQGIAYGLEGAVGVAAARGDVEAAGRLQGAAEQLRDRTGLYGTPTFMPHVFFTAPLTTGEHAEEFEAARSSGHRMSPQDAVAEALRVLGPVDGG
ncbi:hypothetical protein GCM10011512_00570 [Tersicoccus solisilvae]|uniref:DUF4062 domain-containing protein n=1 Tax=Tersicoccus solisilvae TaxID=1882339 RepID=A0ABQ1NMF2_9MICC|nr:DUF4062 domain-containing protein [Tersicoccus solisilvae]GGC77940.1 hypothetical protein GCM10011512_00570 [Tersicoccus solisilvae]